jgi:hypothetical protein
MKHARISPTLLAAALGALFGSIATTQAMPPLSRTLTGVVEHVDAATIIVMPDGENEPRTFRWKPSRTKFVRDAAFTGSNSLREGDRVEVRYRAPIFGEPRATRIFWQTGASRPLPESTQKTKTTSEK